MSQFDELLKALDAVADEQNTDGTDTSSGDDTDETVAAAAADSGVAAPGAAKVDDDAGGDDDDAAPMAKSFVLRDDQGNEQEAVDATQILKSLIGRQDGTEEVLAKAIGTMTQTLKAQGDLIKSLSAKVTQLSDQGRGRKTVLNVFDKPATMAKSVDAQSAPAALSGDEIMAKCLAAQKSGALTGMDVARAEVALNNGVAVPADIVSRIK
jgi:hypothetical protein